MGADTHNGQAGAGFQVPRHKIPRLTMAEKYGILSKVALNFLSLFSKTGSAHLDGWIHLQKIPVK